MPLMDSNLEVFCSESCLDLCRLNDVLPDVCVDGNVCVDDGGCGVCFACVCDECGHDHVLSSYIYISQSTIVQ